MGLSMRSISNVSCHTKIYTLTSIRSTSTNTYFEKVMLAIKRITFEKILVSYTSPFYVETLLNNVADKLKRCNLTFAMSPTCHSNNAFDSIC